MSNHVHNEQNKELNSSWSNHHKNDNFSLIVDNWNLCNEADRETSIDVRTKQSSDDKKDFKFYYQWNFGIKHEFICNNSEYGCHFNEKAPYEPGLHYLTFYANNSKKEINETIEIYVDLYVDITEKPKDEYKPGENVHFAGYVYFCHNCKGKYADVYLKYEQQHEEHFSVVNCGSSGDFLMASKEIPHNESPGTKTIGIFIPNYGIVSSIKDITFEVSGPSTPSPSSAITMTPSPFPTITTEASSPSPTKTPATSTPLMTPTPSPAKTTYTYIPTIQPTPSTTSQPTVDPTSQPTPTMTSQPTIDPSIIPTTSPSEYPTTEITVQPTEIPAPSATADTDSSQGGNSNKEKQKRYAMIGIITAIAVLVVIIVIILIIYYRSRNQDYDPQEDVESREPEVVIPARDYYTHDNPLYSGDNQQITPCVSQCETSQPESDITVFGM